MARRSPYPPGAWWHGGGRIDGDYIVPGDEAGTTRAAGDAVYVTTDPTLAEFYASSVQGPAWVYEVEPISPLDESPSLVGGPTISFTCPQARIVRRFSLSNLRRAQCLQAMGQTNRQVIDKLI